MSHDDVGVTVAPGSGGSCGSAFCDVKLEAREILSLKPQIVPVKSG